MKTAFTFKKWYWGPLHDDQPPHWWTNFTEGKSISVSKITELSRVAKVRQKSNGSLRVVFKSPGDLSFFILRWS